MLCNIKEKRKKGFIGVNRNRRDATTALRTQCIWERGARTYIDGGE